MLPKLEGYAAAILGSLDAAAVAEVARELEVVDATVDTRSDLRAVFTDTAISATSRGAVARDLFANKVVPATARIAAYAALSAPAQDVPGALGDAAHYALEKSHAERYIPHGLSLLAARKRVAGFADAVLEDLPTDAFGAIEDDLFRWARTIEANADLRRLLVDRDASIESRLGITAQLLDGKASAASVRLALYVIEGGRPRDVVGTLDYLVDYTAMARNWRVARVRSAFPLEEVSRQALIASLSALTGTPVDLQITEDPSLLGGILVEVGDLRLDATTRGRLGVLRESVANGATTNLLSNRNEK